MTRRGQSTIEHALFLGAVMAGLLTIQTVVQRGLNARYRTMVDGAVTVAGGSGQYEPYYAKSQSKVLQSHTVSTTYVPGGEVRRSTRDRNIVESGEQTGETNLDADNAWDQK